ncbi:MAG: ParB/RepB/Spo0J family partition protein [bacterium]
MAKAKPGLGRGLDVLLSTVSQTKSAGDSADLTHIPVHKIQRGEYQPRRHIGEEALAELAESIKAQGLVQPVIVRPIPEGYELIAGERRWRACQLAGLDKIPAVVRDIPNEAAAAMSLIENIQREDLNPFEESLALQRLINEFGLTHQQAAEAVGRSRTAVSNLLRLLDLSSGVVEFLETRKMEMGHARALLGLDDAGQLQAAKQIVEKGWSVRETERYVKALKSTKKEKPQPKRSPDTLRLESDLSERLGAPVSLTYNSTGKGKLVISYTNLDELDGILEHIK